MLSFFTGVLTVLMVVDCLLLVLLVLVQLPKKEAGAGLAFGGAATDALFGAGSGNVLTKITKYVAGLFFVLAITLSMLSSNAAKPSTTLSEELSKGTAAPVSAPAAAKPAVKPAAEAPATAPVTVPSTNK